MAVKGGDVIFNFKGNDKELKESVNEMGASIKKMVTALGLDKLISKTISALNNSLDGAIKRVDTLNNFPRVMNNLGIATEDATEAVNELSEGLVGLPTTLNDGVSAVQRFTSQNNDVKKSTKMFLALNNAILAGGASTEVQASAMEQLSQAYAKGKPDAMEWRSMLTAMPAQLKQVAKAMGYTSTAVGGDLYTAIQKGNVSMDDFMETIMRLNEKGVGEFASFAEQAKSSTGGIATSITNVKTAITRGLANSIEALNKSLKNAKLPTVSEMIQKFGTTISKAFGKVNESIGKIKWNKITPVIKEVVQYMKNLKDTAYGLIKSVLKNIDWNMVLQIAPTILKIVATFKVLNPLIKTTSSVLGGLKNIITSLSSPSTALIKVIAGAITTIYMLEDSLKSQKASMNGLREEIQEQKRAWEELKKTREGNLSTNLREIQNTQDLANELKTLVDENGNVKEGYEDRVSFILNELNQALGTEYTLNGNVIQSYKTLEAEVDKLIAKKRVEATLNAFQEEYTTAMREHSKATEQLTKLKKEQAKAAEDIAHKTGKERKEAELLYSSISKKIEEQEDLLGEYGYTIQNYTNLQTASMKKSEEETKKALDNMSISYENYKNLTTGSLQEQEKKQREYVQSLKADYDEAVANNNTYQAEVLKSQINATEQLLNRYKVTAEQSSIIWDESLDFKKPTEEELKKTEAVLENKKPTIKKDVENLSNEANANYLFNPSEKTAVELSNTESIISNNTSIETESKNLASKISSPFTNLNSSKWGTDLIQGLTNGINSGRSSLTGAVSGIAGIIKSWLHFSRPDVGSLRNYEKWMPDFVQGLTKSLETATPNLYGAISKMAGKMKDQLSLGFGMSPTLNNVSSYNPSVNITVQNNMETDFMGNLVSNIKTFSNGSKNDYNYGSGR